MRTTSRIDEHLYVAEGERRCPLFLRRGRRVAPTGYPDYNILLGETTVRFAGQGGR